MISAKDLVETDCRSVSRDANETAGIAKRLLTTWDVRGAVAAAAQRYGKCQYEG
jgi:hypothetical protein